LHSFICSKLTLSLVDVRILTHTSHVGGISISNVVLDINGLFDKG